MKTRYLTAMIILLQISKSLSSQFVQVKPTMSYLEKGMTGFHKYTPQRPHAEIRVRRKYFREVVQIFRRESIFCSKVSFGDPIGRLYMLSDSNDS